MADPPNPVGFTADGKPFRTSPKASPRLAGGDGPARRYALRQAVRTLSAGSLATSANRAPRRAVLFHATDDDRTAAAIERLITICGFDPRKDRRVTQTGRTEVPAAACTNTAGSAASSPTPARDTPSRPLNPKFPLISL